MKLQKIFLGKEFLAYEDGNDRKFYADYSIERETDKAIMIHLDLRVEENYQGDVNEEADYIIEKEQEHWIPKSQIVERNENYFLVKNWVAETKGFKGIKINKEVS